MKRLLLLLPWMLLTGSYVDVTGYIPVFLPRAELEKSVVYKDSAYAMTNPGRIYRFERWLLVVEKYQGVHFIDNTDPAHPIRKGFLRVPGCQNVAIGNHTIYVDNAVDLVGVKMDFASMRSREVSRLRSALPELESPDGYLPRIYRRSVRLSNTEIVGWISNSSTL